ncbi:MAG: UDP-N-acetylmuramate--L-alanine ligase [Candidatus Saganbacteria bacterium]|nr:UDP-N-acetylmuramate--L-alanine ligase [Candidatus Saganbacteria bacterium]
MDLDLERMKNVHLVGIGGCGMSGIAKVLLEMGFKVSGSDQKEGVNTIRLKDLGVRIFIGHGSSQVRDADLLVYSSAVRADNPELAEAAAKGIRIVKRAEVLAWIMSRSKHRVAVAGTHGKTTTTAMTARVLEAARLDPTYLIGCDMDYEGGNARLGGGNYLVAEADESDSSFLYYSPTLEVVTNIEADHMEHFGGMDELLSTFERFMACLPAGGLVVIDGSDPNNQRLIGKGGRRFITYGLAPEMEYGARELSFAGFSSRYVLTRRGQELGAVELSVPGRQNILNSLAVFAVSVEFGLDFVTVAGALRTFVGARRRFSTVGEQNGVLLIDDYAHHPTEISATLKAARSGWPERRIICVFQPHRYTRTMILKEQFAGAFGDADRVIITDVYAASETPLPGVSGRTIAELLDREKTRYLPKKEQIAERLIKELKPGDIVLTLGAGDIYTVGKELLARLKMKHENPA